MTACTSACTAPCTSACTPPPRVARTASPVRPIRPISASDTPNDLRRIDALRTPGQGPAAARSGQAATRTTGSPTLTHLHAFLTHLLAAGTAPGTIRLRRYYLERLAAAHGDLLSLTAGDLAEFLSRSGWSPETRKSARATVRGFYAWALDEDLVTADPARRLPAVRVPRPLPRPVPLRVFAEALMRADVRGRRALLLMRYSGLRRFEVAQLHTDDVAELADGTPGIIVRGKGGKVRGVPLHPKVAGALAGLHGYVFPSTRTAAGHLSPDALGDLVSDLLGPGWSGHSLRHRAASDWFAVDRDLIAVQRLLGHASVATTQIYVAPPPDAMTSAVLGVA